MNKNRRIETPIMVSCSMDKRLFAINIDSGDILYNIELPVAPLCMDSCNGYIAVGLYDGRVFIIKAETGINIIIAIYMILFSMVDIKVINILDIYNIYIYIIYIR